MRIIAGLYKGRPIKCLEGEEIRPTLDRVKEAVFSILQWRTADCCFVDLFSGSGNIGLEAISRGARRVYFSECMLKGVKLIKENITKLNVDRAKYELLTADYHDNLKRILDGSVDIIYADPPYMAREIYENLPRLAYEKLAEDGLLVMEYRLEFTVKSEGYEVISEKKYGDVKIIVLKKLNE